MPGAKSRPKWNSGIHAASTTQECVRNANSYVPIPVTQTYESETLGESEIMQPGAPAVSLSLRTTVLDLGPEPSSFLTSPENLPRRSHQFS